MHAMFRQIGGYLYVRLIFMIFICMIHGADFFFSKNRVFIHFTNSNKFVK